MTSYNPSSLWGLSVYDTLFTALLSLKIIKLLSDHQYKIKGKEYFINYLIFHISISHYNVDKANRCKILFETTWLISLCCSYETNHLLPSHWKTKINKQILNFWQFLQLIYIISYENTSNKLVLFNFWRW